MFCRKKHIYYIYIEAYILYIYIIIQILMGLQTCHLVLTCFTAPDQSFAAPVFQIKPRFGQMCLGPC